MRTPAEEPRQEIVFDVNGETYTAWVGEPMAEDDLAIAAFMVVVEHSSARYAIFLDIREPRAADGTGGYVARPIESARAES